MANRFRRLGAGIFDQVLYSVANFILTVTVARVATVYDFGLFALATAAFLFVSSANRGLTSETLMVRFGSADTVLLRPALKAACSTSLVLGLALGVAFAAVAFCTSGSLSEICFVFAVGSPFLLFQDTLRFCAFTARRPTDALANDGLAIGVQVVGTGLLLQQDVRAVWMYVSLWVVSEACGAVLGASLQKITPTVTDWRLWLLSQAHFSFRYAADNLAVQFTAQGTGYLVAVTSGLLDTAALRTAQTVFAPSAVLGLGVQSAALPDLVRSLDVSPRKMQFQAMRVSALLASTGVLWALVALACPSGVGRALFGASWSRGHDLLIYFALAQVAAGLSGGGAMAMRALSVPNLTLKARSISLFLGVAAAVAGSVTAGALGVAIFTACVGPAQACVWWWYFVRGISDRQRAVSAQRLQAESTLAASSHGPRRSPAVPSIQPPGDS